MRLLFLGLILISINSFGQQDFWTLEHNNKDEYGYRDKKGELRIPFGKYSICYTDTFRTFAIVTHRQLGFVGINRDEKILFQIYPFDNGPDDQQDGLFRIVKGDKIGFADNLGQVIIQPRFKAVMPFSDNLAAYCDNCSKKKDGEHFTWTGGKWGFIDKKGETIINPTFDNVLEWFKDGKAKVTLDKKEFWINKKGKKIG
jgi:WG containing repeat